MFLIVVVVLFIFELAAAVPAHLHLHVHISVHSILVVICSSAGSAPVLILGIIIITNIDNVTAVKKAQWMLRPFLIKVTSIARNRNQTLMMVVSMVEETHVSPHICLYTSARMREGRRAPISATVAPCVR